jgi:hypothetical protein
MSNSTSVLRFVQGDDVSLDFTFKDEDGSIIDITGYTIFFTIKNQGTYQDDSDDSEALASVSGVGSGDEATSGQITITIPRATTELITEGEYVYDIQMKDTSGNIVSTNPGIVKVLADVTKRTS